MEKMNYSYDLGILSLFDANQFQIQHENLEDQILKKTSENLNLFFNELMKIKQEKEDNRNVIS